MIYINLYFSDDSFREEESDVNGNVKGKYRLQFHEIFKHQKFPEISILI